MRMTKDHALLLIVYFLGISALFWTLLTLFYQYIAALSMYKEIVHEFTNSLILSSLWLSVSSSFITSAFAIVLGVPLGYIFAMKEFKGKNLLETLTIDIPQTFPPVAVGIIFLIMLGPKSPIHLNLSNTYWAIILSQFFVSAPFVIAFAARKFAEIRESGLDLIAQTLGAHRFEIFITIFLPLAAKDIMAGASLCWARAMGELGGSLLFAGVIPFKTEVIPTFIAQNASNTPAALAATILATIAAIIALVSFKAITSGRGSWKALFYKM